MSSRSFILSEIRKISVPKAGHPGQGNFSGHICGSLSERFTQEIRKTGGTLHPITGVSEMAEIICREIQPACSWSQIKEVDLPGNLAGTDPSVQKLEELDVVVLPAALGVAENGAVWIDEKYMKPRVLPFITRHLAVILPENRIFENMHLAYDELRDSRYGFGLFLAGPSKTADIEQSLVFGAHGPETFALFLRTGGQAE